MPDPTKQTISAEGTKMTLSEHDVKVKPHLEWIAAGASMAARHARAIPHKMAFTTHAEDELAEAQSVLEAALQNVVAAREAYAGKAVENDRAA